MRVYKSAGGVDEEEVVYPRRGSTEELSSSVASREGLKNGSEAPLVSPFLCLMVFNFGD